MLAITREALLCREEEGAEGEGGGKGVGVGSMACQGCCLNKRVCPVWFLL